jgi:hypothetical protein
MAVRFTIARNPDPASKLPYLLRIPVAGGPLILRAKETWPRTSSVYCHRDSEWPADPEVVEELDVLVCERRGRAIDLVVDRYRENRSQFVFTSKGGRELIFWQTAKTVTGARPGVRIPARRASRQDEFTIVADSRERYASKFASQQAVVTKEPLAAGDYGVLVDGRCVASVERKSLPDLVKSLVDGSLGFVADELAALPHAAVVVEVRYRDLLEVEHTSPGFVLDLLARLQVRYPNVPVVFCETRKLAEEWTFRFLGAARVRAVGELEWGDPTG